MFSSGHAVFSYLPPPPTLGGDECLYDTPTARKLQAEKRRWQREYDEMKEADTAAAAAAAKKA
jgi:hypothetical protein